MEIYAEVVNCNKPLTIFAKAPPQISDGVPYTPPTLVSIRRHTIQKRKYKRKVKAEKKKD